MECTIRTVKEEEIWLNESGGFFEARGGIERYIKFYNEERIHSALGYISPIEFIKSLHARSVEMAKASKKALDLGGEVQIRATEALTFQRWQKMTALSGILRMIVALLFALTAFLVDAERTHAVEDCDFGADVPTTRPNSEAGPTEIHAGIFIFDLVDIDNVRQEFTLDFFLEAEWKDHRLGELLRKSGRRVCEIPTGTVWQPGMFIVNSRKLSHELPRVYYVHDNGTVESENRIMGTFSAHFDLKDFPLDTQTLPITFISTKYGPDEIKIVYEGGGAEEVFTEGEWSVRPAHARAGVYEVEVVKADKEEETEKLALFEIEIEVKRYVKYYIWKVFVPLCLIVFVSWGVFWVDPKEIGVQTGIGTAMMLTIIAFLFSLQNVLPKINYLTRMDIFVYSSLLFVFLALVEALATCTIAAHGRELVARWIDRCCRVIFPSAFTVVVVWFWWV